MGSTLYSSEGRHLRAASSGYFTKSADEIFSQNKEKKIHESMNPKNAKLREARDSEIHPATVPIMLALDVTGSMQKIPHYLVKDGLPHTVGGIIQRGIPSPALLFLAIGDHEYDSYPLQVGQFESGDLELDTWLTRTYLEGKGGGNAGESYLLAWYFAAKHTVTDAWEKRKQKGFLFTTGDEPCLKTLPKNVINELMGDVSQSGYTDVELLEAAQEKWNVYHLHVMQGSQGKRSLGYWENLLGQNCIQIDDYEKISTSIADIVVAHSNVDTTVIPLKEQAQQPSETKDNKQNEEIIL